MRILGATIVLGLVACGSITQPERDESAAIQTDRLSYSFTESDGWVATQEIKVEITNLSGEVAYVWTTKSNQFHVALETREGGEWVGKWSRNLPDGGGTYHLLQPGEGVTFSVEVSGFLPGTCSCSPILDLDGSGIYRLRITEGFVDSYDPDDGSTGEELPLEYRTSNEFALEG